MDIPIIKILFQPRFLPKSEMEISTANEKVLQLTTLKISLVVVCLINPEKDLKIILKTEIKELEIFYTFDNTNPYHLSPKYENPLSVPKDATRIRIVTYKNGKPVGKLISLEIEELKKRL